MCARIVFFQDHDFFKEIYGFCSDSYDDVLERMIGRGMPLDLAKVTVEAAQIAVQAPISVKENKEYYLHIQSKFKVCNQMIEVLCAEKGQTQGTIQLLGDIANKIEGYQYKIAQRIK